MKRTDDKHFQTEEQPVRTSHHWSLPGSFGDQRPVRLKHSEQEGPVGKIGQAGGQDPAHSTRCQFHVFKGVLNK